MHKPVMLNEAMKYLNVKSNGLYIDATFGAGGHSMEILKYLNFHGKVIGLDKNLIHTSYNNTKINMLKLPFDVLSTLSKSFDMQLYDGIVIDLGMSTNQIQNKKLGFSSTNSSFLDMRFNQSQKIRAIDWLNNATAPELIDVFSFFRNKKIAYKLTSTILTSRKKNIIKTSNDITDLIKKTYNTHSVEHKIFNLIRMFINNEIFHFENLLNNITFLLKKDATITLISFNSLEDKIAKNYITKNNEEFIDFRYKLKPLNKEINNNISSRSAIMRIFKKI